jgi:hypothetical protein
MITTKDHDELLAEIVNVRKMLYGLLKTIRTWDKQKPQRPVR